MAVSIQSCAGVSHTIFRLYYLLEGLTELRKAVILMAKAEHNERT
jgi:hypothetical protein